MKAPPTPKCDVENPITNLSMIEEKEEGVNGDYEGPYCGTNIACLLDSSLSNAKCIIGDCPVVDPNSIDNGPDALNKVA
jgi:hypothetical protein